MRSLIFKLLFTTLFFTLFSVAQTLGAVEVNRLRVKSGMIPLKYSKALSNAAHNHAKYLARLRLNTHFENPKKRYFTGKTPFERMAKAGFGSRVGVENISFAESSYRSSVEVLFSTVYHRLAFLDFRIDSIGTSAYGNRRGRVYVYDMASSEVSKICKNSKSRGRKRAKKYIFGVCREKNLKVPLSMMRSALRSVESRNSRVVIFPYQGALVRREFINETPNPFRKRVKVGFPISLQLNPAYYRSAKIEKFRIFNERGERLKAKLITYKNDIRKKISPLSFILIPNSPLKSKKRYKVLFEASTNRGRVRKEWSFRVK